MLAFTVPSTTRQSQEVISPEKTMPRPTTSLRVAVSDLDVGWVGCGGGERAGVGARVRVNDSGLGARHARHDKGLPQLASGLQKAADFNRRYRLRPGSNLV